ncbi:unnamed protein product [Blepharisma stoltei]|uniref:Uncharacterized protein n=1 Tax=Blepharisma stoltei TaxID=1481888 RepID=A0AAU9JKC1_9CILI|nr:unnamed protein product [Blepharisma stoltei]
MSDKSRPTVTHYNERTLREKIRTVLIPQLKSSWTPTTDIHTLVCTTAETVYSPLATLVDAETLIEEAEQGIQELTQSNLANTHNQILKVLATQIGELRSYPTETGWYSREYVDLCCCTIFTYHELIGELVNEIRHDKI